MSTSSEILSLASDLVLFLAGASFLAVLVLRPDLLRVNTLGRTVLAGTATLLAVVALFHGAFSDVTDRQQLLDNLRIAAVVLLALGCLGVGARWPRTALLASLALLVVAETVVPVQDEHLGDLLRFLGGCGIGLALWLAARRSLATRIAAAAGVLLVAVVLVLSGVLSQVLRDNVSKQALERATDRARIEAKLINGKKNDALGQADFISKVIAFSPDGRDAVARKDSVAVGQILKILRNSYGRVDFLAYFDAEKNNIASDKDKALGPTVLAQLDNSPIVAEAFKQPFPAPAGGVEPTQNDSLMALGVQLLKFRDARGVETHFGAIVAGFFIDRGYLADRVADQKDTDLSIVGRDLLLASTLSREDVKEQFDVLDGDDGRALVTEVFRRGTESKRQGQLKGLDKFVAAAAIPPPRERVPPNSPPTAAVIVTIDGKGIAEARASLFRTLFLVALGAAALALALAAAAGSRLGAPLRKLALTAEQISRGDLSVRSGLRSPDEIGLLGSSFDEMAGSIERMASELREGAAQMEAVLNSMTDGLVAADPVGLVAMMNPAAEAMLGVRGTREMGKPVANVIRAKDRTGSSLSDRFELPNFEAWSAVGFVENRHDKLLPVALSGAPIRSEHGGVLGAIYVLRDMRRELEIERAKTEFLSNISHELRTPLTPIKGYAEMLRRDQHMPETRQLTREKVGTFLDGILESSERLERIVDILVNFAAMEAGKLVLRSEPVDVAGLVHEICERWGSRSDRHRVEEHVSGRPRLLADRRLLERAIDELVDNAVKFSPEGGVVSVQAELIGATDGRAVEISVDDEGIGIAPADFDRIFADFSQLDGSATRRYGGLGLGLPFVQRVVAAHNGTLDCTSELGRGSRFVIRVPVASPVTGNGSAGGSQ